jgi:hypothetical protein
LESAVESLDGTSAGAAGTVYDDFRFVTRAQLAELELDHLLGTALLRSHMHGFFIDNRLYKKARARIEPFSYEVYRQKRIAEKLEEERQSRIAMVCPYTVSPGGGVPATDCHVVPLYCITWRRSASHRLPCCAPILYHL